MTYRFVIHADEAPDFRREITISSNATFREFHDYLLECVGYTLDEMTFFSLADRNWIPYKSILLADLGMHLDEDEEPLLMDDYRLSDFLKSEGDRMLFTYDILSDRSFYISLASVDKEREIDVPELVVSTGTPPDQMSDPMDLLLQDVSSKYRLVKSADSDEDEEMALDDEEFGLDDLDLEDLDFL
ncbi:MAG: hypothetical protein Q4D93_06095 [Porphyromonas sp.]|nr:hypothetical protein [Porphyromonas sp.]